MGTTSLIHHLVPQTKSKQTDRHTERQTDTAHGVKHLTASFLAKGITATVVRCFAGLMQRCHLQWKNRNFHEGPTPFLFFFCLNCEQLLQVIMLVVARHGITLWTIAFIYPSMLPVTNNRQRHCHNLHIPHTRPNITSPVWLWYECNRFTTTNDKSYSFPVWIGHQGLEQQSSIGHVAIWDRWKTGHSWRTGLLCRWGVKSGGVWFVSSANQLSLTMYKWLAPSLQLGNSTGKKLKKSLQFRTASDVRIRQRGKVCKQAPGL